MPVLDSSRRLIDQKLSELNSPLLQREVNEYTPSVQQSLATIDLPSRTTHVRAEAWIANALVPVLRARLNTTPPRGTGQPSREARLVQRVVLRALTPQTSRGRTSADELAFRNYIRRIALVLFDIGIERGDITKPAMSLALATLLRQRYEKLRSFPIPPSIFRKRGHLLDPDQVQRTYDDAQFFFKTQNQKRSLARTAATLVLAGRYPSAFCAWRRYEYARRSARRLYRPSEESRSLVATTAILVMMGRYKTVKEARAAYQRKYREALETFGRHPQGKALVGTAALLAFRQTYGSVRLVYRSFERHLDLGRVLCRDRGFAQEHLVNAVRLVLVHSCPSLELALGYLSNYVRPGRPGHRAHPRAQVSLADFVAQHTRPLPAVGGDE